MGLKLKQDVVVVVRRKKGRKDGIEEREKESVRRNKNCRVENDERERERETTTNGARSLSRSLESL